MKRMSNQPKASDHAATKKSLNEALEGYIKDKNSVKEFSLCMQESTQWLKDKEK